MALVKGGNTPKRPIFRPVPIYDFLRSRGITLEKVEVDPVPNVMDKYMTNAIMLGYTENLYVVSVRGNGVSVEGSLTFSATGFTEAPVTVAQWCVLNLHYN